MNTQTPPGDVSVTAPGCDACGQPLPAGRSRRFCCAACRQAAYRRRHQTVAAEAPLQPRRSRLQGTIYQCPDCETGPAPVSWTRVMRLFENPRSGVSIAVRKPRA